METGCKKKNPNLRHLFYNFFEKGYDILRDIHEGSSNKKDSDGLVIEISRLKRIQ